MQNSIMKYFEFAHLPPHLQEVSRPIGELARQMNERLPDGQEKSAGLRKLLEAKDCLVRARLEKPTKDSSQENKLPPYQQRVIEEKAARDGEIERLAAFIAGPVFTTVDADEQERMTVQLSCMRELSGILGQRIAAFTS